MLHAEARGAASGSLFSAFPVNDFFDRSEAVPKTLDREVALEMADPRDQ